MLFFNKYPLYNFITISCVKIIPNPMNNTDKLKEEEWCHYSDLPSPLFYMTNNKKIIKKRVLECIIESQKNIEWGKTFPNDFDERISKSIKLREKYNDIIPITEEMIQDALDYIDALSIEDYETCNNFIIE